MTSSTSRAKTSMADTALAGARLLIGVDGPSRHQEGLALIEAAVLRHDPFAMRLMAALAARGAGVEQSWQVAISFLKQACDHGDESAAQQLDLMRAELGNALEAANWIAQGDAIIVHGSPLVAVQCTELKREDGRIFAVSC